MKKKKRTINVCLANVNGLRCKQIRQIDDIFCIDHKGVCPECRYSYKLNGIYCYYCSLRIIYDPTKKNLS